MGDIGLGYAMDLSFGDLGFGVINLAELSWLWDLSSQPDAFTLATISFDAIALGSTALEFSGVNLGDGERVLEATLGTGKVTATPIPSPLILLGSGLMGIVGFRRKKQKA